MLLGDKKFGYFLVFLNAFIFLIFLTVAVLDYRVEHYREFVKTRLKHHINLDKAYLALSIIGALSAMGTAIVMRNLLDAGESPFA